MKIKSGMFFQMFSLSVAAAIIAAAFMMPAAFGWANPTQTPGQSTLLTTSPTGKVGIGTVASGSLLGVSGGVAVGSSAPFVAAPAPAGGLIVENRLGVGSLTPPSNTFSVNGSALIGYAGFAGSASLATNNMVVNGNVGIGMTNPVARIDIDGGGIRVGDTLLQGRWNSRIPTTNRVSTVASGNFFNPSIVIGRDGAPIITYDTGVSGTIVPLKCLTLDCATSIEFSSAVVSGRFPALAIGASGFPFIAFWDNGTEIKLLRCTDDACSSPVISTVVSGLTNGILQVGLAIDTQGFPIVVYKTTGPSGGGPGTCSSSCLVKFRLARCADQTCSAPATPIQFHADCTMCESAGLSLNIAMGADGLPVLAYSTTQFSSQAFPGFFFLKCTSPSCNPAPSPTSIVYASGSLTTRPTIAIGRDGFPFISAAGIKCTSFDCSGLPSIVPQNNAVTIGIDDLPILSFAGSNLSVTKCRKSDCASSFGATNPTSVVDNGAVQNSVIVIGVDGLPIIAAVTNGGNLEVAKCGSDRCVSNWTRR